MKKRKFDLAPAEMSGEKNINLILFGEPEEVQNEDSYPYETVNDDHCETPLRAYQDIQRLLGLLADRLGNSIAELKIYDPYYCEGNVVKRLNSLGDFKCFHLQSNIQVQPLAYSMQ